MSKYEMVIGLEVHVELKTNSKIFCACKTEFGKAPNTQVCPVCLGLPGSLPVLNRKVVDYAIKAGLATNCQITKVGKQDRKNYFYPDLPKAYQISQYDQPLCYKGFIEINDKNITKTIGITRIHIEEDAGKLVHHKEKGTLIDYNRGGVPLIEIVSEPDIRSATEAKLYLQKLRGILLYTGISDCKMNEGSFRCDVNLSIRKPGEDYGTRTEMKNLNSFTSITKAIENEYLRQIKVLETGGQVVQETRKWDQDKNKSFSMRTKEDAHDYRYFPDPDLQPIVLSKEHIERIRKELPEMPDVKRKKYEKIGLSAYDAEQIALDLELAEYFEAVIGFYNNPKQTANLLSEMTRLQDKYDEEIQISPVDMATVIERIDQGIINSSLAKKIFEILWQEQLTVDAIIERDDLKLITDERKLQEIVITVVLSNEKIVKDYMAGKKKALQSLVGQVMKTTEGKADPELTLKLIRNELTK